MALFLALALVQLDSTAELLLGRLGGQRLVHLHAEQPERGAHRKLDHQRDGLQSRHHEAQHRGDGEGGRSEEHTSELQSLMRISYAVFCLKHNKYTEYISL